VEQCTNRGAVLRAVPPGRGVTSADVEANRLRPTPAKQPRRRRGAASIKAAPAAAGADGGGGAAAMAAEPRWNGYRWVRQSLLKALKARKSAEAAELKKQHPCLKAFDGALREFLGVKVGALPAETVASVSLRPGMRLRRADSDPERNRRVKAHRCAPRRRAALRLTRALLAALYL